MPEYRDLTLEQNNDVALTGTVTTDDADEAPVDLTAVTIEMRIKPSAAVDDDAATVTVLSTDTGEIVRGEETGAYSVEVPAAALATAGPSWYRVDTVSAGRRRTVVKGVLWVDDS